MFKWTGWDLNSSASGDSTRAFPLFSFERKQKILLSSQQDRVNLQKVSVPAASLEKTSQSSLKREEIGYIGALEVC